jgi:hypothetical protein
MKNVSVTLVILFALLVRCTSPDKSTREKFTTYHAQ